MGGTVSPGHTGHNRNSELTSIRCHPHELPQRHARRAIFGTKPWPRRNAATVAPRRPARAGGRWYAYAWGAHAFETSVIAVFLSRYLPAVAKNAVGANGRLHILGIPIAPASLFAYVVSFCAIVLVFLMPIAGAVADRTGRKRELMLTFGYLGAASCAAMWFVGRTDWALGTGLMIAGFLTYTCAKVVMNSMLSDLAEPNERDRISSYGWRPATSAAACCSRSVSWGRSSSPTRCCWPGCRCRRPGSGGRCSH